MSREVALLGAYGAASAGHAAATVAGGTTLARMVALVTLRDLGLDPLVPDRSRLGPMIRVLTERLASQAQRGQAPMAAGLSIRGSVIEIDGTRIELSDKEAALVAALSRRSGTVVSRAALLEAVWDRNTSAHTVDVTVARLRRRLGNLAGLVETVPRRGYRWNSQRV